MPEVPSRPAQLNSLVQTLRLPPLRDDIKHETLADLAALAGAQSQHRDAWAVTHAATARHGSVKKWCEHAELNQHRLWAVLRGETQMRSADMGLAYFWLGEDVEDALATFDERRKESPNWLIDIA